MEYFDHTSTLTFLHPGVEVGGGGGLVGCASVSLRHGAFTRETTTSLVAEINERNAHEKKKKLKKKTNLNTRATKRGR